MSTFALLPRLCGQSRMIALVTHPNEGRVFVVASGVFTPAEKFEIKKARARARSTARGAFLSPTQRVIKRRSRRQTERTSPGAERTAKGRFSVTAQPAVCVRPSLCG